MRVMEAAMEVDVEAMDGIDPLEVMAGVAAGATPAPKHRGKAPLHTSRSKCWLEGCE